MTIQEGASLFRAGLISHGEFQKVLDDHNMGDDDHCWLVADFK